MTENLDPIQEENIPMELAVEDATPEVAEATETIAPAEEQTEATEDTSVEKKVYATRQEVIDRLAEIVHDTTDAVKSEVAYLKVQYYKMRQQETDAELQTLLDGDGDATEYVSKVDELEPRLKELLNVQREARAAIVEARNKELAENLAAKQVVLDKMETIATDANDVNQHYNTFIDLQKQFKEIGQVDGAEVNNLWKRYTQLNEQFYDLLKINKELRDYDFKKNLERKLALCEEAESLGTAGDVIAAFRRLQELHEEWKGLGPIAPALREETWARFKAASTVINKRHQAHFDQIKAAEAENEAGKTLLCEKIEAIDCATLDNYKLWEEQTANVLAIQEAWRKLGFANKKVNNILFERFRKACDAFFAAKAEFFKSLKEEQNKNLERKTALCEKAEALQDSTEWRKTSDKFVSLQKEWKTIGPVPRKVSNALWKRFVTACDTFFAAKEKAVGSEKIIENANLEKKQEILKRLEELKENVDTTDSKTIRDIMSEWNQIGHVPFKEKDKLFNAYQKLLDFFFDKLDMKGNRARMNNFKANVSKIAAGEKPQDSLMQERQRLMRQYERLTADLKTYENNLGFLSLSSKSGNSLISQMEKRKEALKEEINTIVEKIDVIDKSLEA